MTIDEAIKHAEEVVEEKETEGKLLCQSEGASIGCLTCAEEHRQLAEWLKELKALKADAEWIPMIRREPTEEEKAEYFAQNGEELCYMLDNEMPLNRQGVLVSSGDLVLADVFDEEFCNFKDCDIECVDAWRPLPKPYNAGGENKKMTNGEKMRAVFPDIKMWGVSKDTLDYSLGGMIHRVMKSWWNAEYKAESDGSNGRKANLEKLEKAAVDAALDFEYEGQTIRKWVEDLKRFKTPETVRYEGDRLAFCPRCNHTFELLYESWENEFHCPNCGQKLRWEE